MEIGFQMLKTINIVILAEIKYVACGHGIGKSKHCQRGGETAWRRVPSET